MLSKIERTSANSKLKELMKNYADSYRAICSSSRDEYIKGLQPGGIIPKEDRLYSSAARQQFGAKCEEYRAQAHAIIDKSTKTLKEQATAAPTTEAVNAITLLSLRKNVSQKEYETMLEKYGDNPLAFMAIKERAAESGVHFGDHPVFEQLENIEQLTRTVDTVFRVENAESGHTSEGYLAFMSLDVDSAFPVE